MREPDAIRLQEKRCAIEKPSSRKSRKCTNKSPPPPAPKTKAPPANMIERQPKSPTKAAQLSQGDERCFSCSSGGEERGNIVAGPIGLTRPEKVTWPHNHMELSIAELKDELESNRYVEGQRSSQAFEIICDPGKLGEHYKKWQTHPPKRRSAPCKCQMKTTARQSSNTVETTSGK